MDWSILIPLALYVSGVLHHWRATVIYRRWQDAVDHNERIMAASGHEKGSHAYKALRTVPGVRLYGPENVEEHSGVISFTLNGVAVTDIAGFLDKEGIAIRGGKHCCHPAMTALGIEKALREAGIQEGETVIVGEWELEWQD